MPTYPVETYVNAIQRKRELDAAQPTITGSFGAGMGQGIIKGADNFHANLAAAKKAQNDLLIKTLDDYAIVKQNPDGSFRNPDGSYNFISPSQINLDTLQNDRTIKMIPKSLMKVDKPAETKPTYTVKVLNFDSSNGKYTDTGTTQQSEENKPIIKEYDPTKVTRANKAAAGKESPEYKNLYTALSKGIAQAQKDVALYGDYKSGAADPTMMDMAQKKQQNLTAAMDYLTNSEDIDGARQMIQAFNIKETPKQVKKGAFGIDRLAKDIPAKKEVVVSRPGMGQPAAPQAPDLGAQPDLRQQAIDALKANGHPATEANIAVIMKQLSGR